MRSLANGSVCICPVESFRSKAVGSIMTLRLFSVHRRHHKKLRRGMHSGNQFNIVLRDFSPSPDLLEERLSLIQQLGVPNYFAEQRFGHSGNNLHEAQRLIEADRLKGNRRGTGIYLSAARSWLFNLLVERRIEINNLSASIEGDETAALWGRGRSNTSAAVVEIETAVLADWQSWCYALEHAGFKTGAPQSDTQAGKLTLDMAAAGPVAAFLQPACRRLCHCITQRNS